MKHQLTSRLAEDRGLFLLAVLVVFDAHLQEPNRFFRPARSGDLERFPALLVVGDEELLKLRQKCLAHIVD